MRCIRASSLASLPLAVCRRWQSSEMNKIFIGCHGAHATVSLAALQAAIDGVVSTRAVTAQRQDLSVSIEAKRKEIEALEVVEESIEKKCTAHSGRVLKGIGLSLSIQFAILFNWVFFVFDWNLVEPVTYFLGYTVTWWSLVFYNRTGLDFSYDGIIAAVEERKRNRLQKKMGFDAKKLSMLRSERFALQNKLREL